jgi:hypothetical protein
MPPHNLKAELHAIWQGLICQFEQDGKSLFAAIESKK